LLNGSTEIKLGSIHPTRDFNFVKDTIAGFIAIAETQSTIGEEINIASQQEISIGQLANEIIGQINPAARIVTEDIRVRPEKSEVERLIGSNEKIRRLTGWHPKYTLKEGIRETIEWFRDAENLRNYKWNVYNV
jgi:nucleoside-diphosphate-sugar epimerase